MGYLRMAEMDQGEDDTLRDEKRERRVPMAIIMERENQSDAVEHVMWTCGRKPSHSASVRI